MTHRAQPLAASEAEALSQEARAAAIIHRLAATLGAVDGEAFFPSLVAELTSVLDLDYAMVAEVDADCREATILAAAGREGVAPTVTYSLAGTPCEDVLAVGQALILQGVGTRFPGDPRIEASPMEAYVGVTLLGRGGRPVGLLVIMHRQPIDDGELVAAVLHVFASRAAAELERTRAEAALRTSEERYRRFFEDDLAGICVLAPDGRITACNPAFARIFAFESPIELLSANVLALFDAAAPLAALLARLETETTLRGLELEVNRWDGRPLHLVGSLVAERKDGRVSRVTGHWIDNTQRKLAEQRLRHAQRLESIGTLAGGIAHDLNNVLAPVLMSVDLLSDLVRDERGQRLLASIERSTRRGMDLVRQVLWFARGVDGERRTFAPDRLVGEVVKIVRESFPKNIEVVPRVAEDLPPIAGDPTQLYQVMMSLAVNARDAMPRGGTLGIEARRVEVGPDRIPPGASHSAPGPFLELAVVDSGTGIAPEVLDRIFEPFFTTKPPGEGSGLGLSTAHSIAASHDGFLEVETSATNGSVFRMLLPFAAAPEGAAEPAPADAVAAPERGRGELILVVDDEPTIRDVCSETLESFGYRALTAADGAEAVALFARYRAEVAAVITDLAMPIMDGPATIRSIRRLSGRVPILAMSGLADRYGLEEIEEHGISSFLTKPFSADDLLARLGGALGSRPPS
jgi:PAS domain S-box-containing protein